MLSSRNPAPKEDRTPEGQPKPRGAKLGRPTKRQIEERNRELLERAFDLFLEKGFEGTTILEITQSVGMAKRTVTARYGNKVALFKAALKRAIDDWAVPEKRLRAGETADLEETLLNVGRTLANSYLEPANLKLARITNAASHTMPERRRRNRSER